MAALSLLLAAGPLFADAPALISPEESGQIATPPAKSPSLSSTVIENFNCESGACIFTLQSVVQVQTFVDCHLDAVSSQAASNFTSWYDFHNYPASSDGGGNSLGAQSLSYYVDGAGGDSCNRTEKWVVLYRNYTGSPYQSFYGSCITLHFRDGYYIGKESAAAAVMPAVHLQVKYTGETLYAVGRQTVVSSGGWQTLTVNLDPTRSVEQVLIAVGGAVLADDEIYFDDLTVCDYSTTPPDCYVSTTSLDFGTVEIGAHSDRSFTIANHGGGTLQGSVSESCLHYEIVSGGGSYSLGGDQSRDVTVRYAPTSGGTHNCTVNMGTSACGTVSCTGSTPPECSVSPPTLSFGTVAVGDSKELTFTVSNEGGGSLPVFVDLSCGAFNVITADRNVYVEGGETKTFTVRYTPDDEDGDSCSIGLGVSCGPLPMEGLGYIDPACSIDPPHLDFDIVELGSHADIQFSIRNDGGGSLGGVLAATCGPFSILDSDRSYSLTAGQSKMFTARFTPEAEGEDACTLSTGSDYCAGVTAYGFGEAPPLCNLLPNTLRFDRVVVGDSADMLFTVSNSGGGLVSGDVEESCGPFRVIDAITSYSLASGESQSFTVRFTPTAEESSACALTTGLECGSLNVEGIAYIPAVCEIDPLSVDFGGVLIDTSALRSITVRNSGGDRLSGTVSLGCNSFSLVTADPSFDLGGGEEKTFVVRFDPADEETCTCSLSAGDQCGGVSLAGEGTVQPVCVLSVPSLDFGISSVEETPGAAFGILNSGTGILSGEVSAQCGPFRVTDTDRSYSLGAGASRTFHVVFEPDTVGAYLCSLDTGLPCGPLALSAVADPPPVCLVAPRTIDFGTLFVGETWSTGVTISNAGGATLSGEMAAGCGPFTVADGDRAYSLGAGESKEFTISFTPAGSGLFDCALESGTSCDAIDLSGEGRDSCALAITSPNGGEFFTEGEVRTVTWEAGACGGSVSIELYRDTLDAPCAVIADSTENDGLFEWTVAHCGGAGDDYRVRIALRERTGFDTISDSTFTIDNAPSAELPDTSLAANLDPVAINPAESRSFRIVNRGARTLNWTASSDEQWVSLETDSGIVAVGETLSVSVFLDPATLRGGDTSAVVTIVTDDPRMPRARVRIAANVRQYQRGDVTVNDVVNVLDIARLVDHVVGATPLFEPIVRLGIADMNDDLVINVSDLVGLSRLLSTGTGAKPSGMKSVGAALIREQDGSLLLRVGGPGNVRAGLVDIDWGEGGVPGGLRAIGEGSATITLYNDRERGITRLAFFALTPAGPTSGPAKGISDSPVARIFDGNRAKSSPRINGGSLAAGGGGIYELLDVAPGAGSTSIPARLLFLAPAPNPARAGTNLSFQLARHDRVRLAVYDTAGRMVRVIADRSFPAGRHELTWDGRDSAGRHAPNGLYFIRLEAAGEKLSRKAMLVR